MTSCTAEKVRGVRRHGPVSVLDDSEVDGPLKLYAFCKRSFPQISKKGLQKCFLAGSILVNEKRNRCGHEDESRRLKLGDVIEILIDLDAADALVVESTELNILHSQDGYSMISKACGVSAAFDKELDKALKSKLWNGRRKKECQLLYHLEKGFSGICIVAETAEHLLRLRHLSCVDRYVHTEENEINADVDITSNDTQDGNVCTQFSQATEQSPFLELIHRCIICGKIGEVGDNVLLDTGHKLYPEIEAKVLSISRCRSKGFISLIDVRVTFDSESMGVDYHSVNGADIFDLKGNNDMNVTNSNEEENENLNDISSECDSNEGLDFEPDQEHNFSVMSAVLTVEKVKKPATAADYRFLHYPTVRLRSVKRALSLCGHQIVGDGGAVKSAKGIFAAIVSVTIFDPPYFPHFSPSTWSDNSSSTIGDTTVDTFIPSMKPFTVSVDDPKKFAKLMLKEQQLWELAEGRDQEVLRAWNLLSLGTTKAVVNEGQARIVGLGVDGGGGGGVCVIGTSSDAYTQTYLEAAFKSNTAGSYSSSNSVDPHPTPSEAATSTSTSTSTSRFSSLAEMRAAMTTGMPVEYVLGEATFCGSKFLVNSDVMVPRKSSEVLVNEALNIITHLILPDKLGGHLGCDTNDLKLKLEGCHVQSEEISARLCSSECAGNALSNQLENGNGANVVSLKVLDIGTGSGCLLLSCLQKIKEFVTKNIPQNQNLEFEVRGLGIDLSPEALRVARDNAALLGLEALADFRVMDFTDLTALLSSPSADQLHPRIGSSGDVHGRCQVEGLERDLIELDTAKRVGEMNRSTLGRADGTDSEVQDPEAIQLGPFDVILCNPPYSSRRDTTRLSVASREHEPALALFSPQGPLAAYRTLAASLTVAEGRNGDVDRARDEEREGGKDSKGVRLDEECKEGKGGNRREVGVGDMASRGLFRSNAHLLLEVGHGQVSAVQKIFSKLAFLTFVIAVKDHKGIDRCLVYRYCR